MAAFMIPKLPTVVGKKNSNPGTSNQLFPLKSTRGLAQIFWNIFCFQYRQDRGVGLILN